MSTFDIRDLRKAEAEKYAHIQAAKDKAILKELQELQEQEDILTTLDVLLDCILTAADIIEIDTHVVSFMAVLDTNPQLLVTNGSDVTAKVYQVINNVSLNPNTRFDVTKKDASAVAHERIVENIKLMSNLVGISPAEIGVESMDTGQDEHIARQLQNEQADLDEPPEYTDSESD